MIFAIACNADMAELADAPALGAGVFDVGVQIPLSAPTKAVAHQRRRFCVYVVFIKGFDGGEKLREQFCLLTEVEKT